MSLKAREDGVEYSLSKPSVDMSAKKCMASRIWYMLRFMGSSPRSHRKLPSPCDNWHLGSVDIILWVVIRVIWGDGLFRILVTGFHRGHCSWRCVSSWFESLSEWGKPILYNSIWGVNDLNISMYAGLCSLHVKPMSSVTQLFWPQVIAQIWWTNLLQVPPGCWHFLNSRFSNPESLHKHFTESQSQ